MSILSRFANDPGSRSEDVGRPKVRTFVIACAVAAMMAGGAETSVEQKPQNFSFTMPETSQTISDINDRINPPDIQVDTSAGTPESDKLDDYVSTADIRGALAMFSPNDHEFNNAGRELRQRMVKGESTITWAESNFMGGIAGQIYKANGDQALTQGQFDGLVDFFQENLRNHSVSLCVNDMGPSIAATSRMSHKCLMDIEGLDAGPKTGKSEFYQKLRAKIDHNGPSLG